MSLLTLWGTQVIIRASSAAPDADPPTWVDLSDYVTFRAGDLTIATGQQTDLAESPEPGTAQLAWRNDGHEFSDPAGAFPWFKEARRVQVLEVVDGQTFPLFDGYLGPPQHVPMVDMADASMSILTTVSTATDRLARLRNAGAFISTLTEYIRFAGGSRLVAYWPLLESAGTTTFTNVVGSSTQLTPRHFDDTGFTPVTSPSTTALLAAAAAPPLFTDDRPGLAFQTDSGDVAGLLTPTRWTLITGYPSVTYTNSTITLVFWYYADISRQPTTANAIPCVLSNFNTVPVGRSDIWLSSTAGTSWTAFFETGASFVSFTTPSPRVNAWNLISLSMTLPSGACTAYVHNMTTTTGVLSGSPPSTLTFTQISAGVSGVNGGVAHMQIWVGPYTQADHDAQLLAAQTGLERQLTGARVNTILDYAGVPTSQRDVQGGVPLMQVASLAGKDPLTCLEEARRTERGRLFMSGDGRVTFQDRDTVYNVA